MEEKGMGTLMHADAFQCFSCSLISLKSQVISIIYSILDKVSTQNTLTAGLNDECTNA